ncbi:YhgE/Pip domain-containing protein [Microbacterium terricola]|uniref:ABC-2 type transporter transmembrane domain-containing protein n=1 Tax=Microbacterium terricola TaxID=344163 RepID=A0ABM8E324_9MICO|nr:YhgE/Pip domain-containing protein [Microbacterium terricola]UYK39946.1 YhgE/Pip domain-containing protein [Microbacterium terricola]BDV32373.1 hypothetical protein Microterr_30330 [Microbacterium terricola]
MSVSAVLTALKKSRRTRVVLTGIALVPLIYAGVLTWANLDPTHNLDGVPAAVVDEDSPTVVDGSRVDLGATLTDELTSSTSEDNFDWRRMSADDAASALASGEVLAVLTVPEDFSATATSVAGDDPAAAAPATLSIESNDGASMISGTIATTIAHTIRTTLADEVAAEYLDKVYLGFTTLHDELGDAADGAGDLADGATTAADGSGALVVGLNELADGSTRLADGAQTLADGAHDVDAGAGRLSSGLDELAAQTTDLPAQTARLSAGAGSAASGAKTLSTGLDALSTGATTLDAGATAALGGAQRIGDGLSQLAASTPTLAAGAGSVSDGLDSLIANWAHLSDTQRQATLTTLAAGAHAVAGGATTADGAAQSLATGATSLVGSAADGTGLAALAQGAGTLADGTATAAAGAHTLRDGSAQLAAGAEKLAGKTPTLRDAIATAAAGASALATGSSDLADGAATLAGKTGELAAGAGTAADGGQDLARGLTTLSLGADDLRDGLAGGVADVPTYTDAEAAHLSEVAASPVEVDATRVNEVPAYGYGLAPYFTALALWVGALAFYLMMPALSRRALEGRGSAFTVALRSYLPGAAIGLAQSVLATGILVLMVGIHPADSWGLFGMIALTSVTFVAINQALIALLGAPGRFLALVLIVLQLAAAGATYPIQTSAGFFQTIHSWLPLTHSVEAFRSLIAGGDIGIAAAVGVLLAWLAGALAVTVFATRLTRRRERIGIPIRAPRPAQRTSRVATA